MFPTLAKHSKVFEENREKIASAWVSNSIARDRLLSHEIDPEFFSKHFGIRVVDYAIGVIEGGNELGNCPVIHVLLEFFHTKHIALNDLFMICASLRNVVLHFAAEAGIADMSFIDEFTTLMDVNFEGVMIEYMERIGRQDTPILLHNKISKPTEHHFVSGHESKKISAKDFFKNATISKDDIDEMRDLEEDALESLDIDTMCDEQRARLLVVLKKYVGILKDFEEFNEVKASLTILVEILEQAVLINFDKNKKAGLVNFCRGLVMDLRGWRTSIFVDQSTEDIYWLDDSLIALMAQLQVILAPMIPTQKETLELF